ISIRRRPSATASVERMLGCLSAGDASKDSADRHPEAGQIAPSQHVARHDLPGRVQIPGGRGVLHQNLSAIVYFHTEIRERDPWTQWISEIWRAVDAL